MNYSREFLAINSAPYICVFCEEQILIFTGLSKMALIVHHIDGDHYNNDPKNWAATHRGCHSTHHNLGHQRWAGKKHSPETRAKMSSAMQGKRNALGFRHTQEAKEKIRAANLNRSVEHQNKISTSLKAGAGPRNQIVQS